MQILMECCRLLSAEDIRVLGEAISPRVPQHRVSFPESSDFGSQEMLVYHGTLGNHCPPEGLMTGGNQTCQGHMRRSDTSRPE